MSAHRLWRTGDELSGELAELTAEDAAAIVETSPEVVRQRVHRARLMLRGLLDRLWSL